MNVRIVIKKVLILVFLFFFPFMFSCTNEGTSDSHTSAPHRDLSLIQQEGKLKVVTDFNSINYFIYRGKPMGFQYELLQALSDYLGLEIEVKVNSDLQSNFQNLIDGKTDIIASNLTMTPERKELFDFTLPYNQTQQVLIQREVKHKNSLYNPDRHVGSAFELEGKTVYVQRKSSHAERLHELAGEKGLMINIVEVPIETEQLIKMVSSGEIDYTVADDDVALVNRRFLNNINMETVLSVPQKQAWAVRKDSPELKSEINNWLNDFKKTRKYALLYNKYFLSGRNTDIHTSAYYYPETGKISAYDNIFKKESQSIGWDWRLLASMVYQESRFNSDARSWAGAFGIMQLMPRTAQRFGVNQNSSTLSQIKAGVKLIKWLDMQLDDKISDKDERIKFVLAAYNIGLGHVQDAMRLAEKYGKDSTIWEDNVEYFLLKKSDPNFYNDPVVNYGYARGTETYNYVRDILYRYNHYLNMNDNVTIAQLVQ
jgi:membrane-bound lytic murein transglycosylase F